MEKHNTEPDRLRALAKHLIECILLTNDPAAAQSLIKCSNEITDRRQQLLDERRHDYGLPPTPLK